MLPARRLPLTAEFPYEGRPPLHGLGAPADRYVSGGDGAITLWERLGTHGVLCQGEGLLRMHPCAP